MLDFKDEFASLMEGHTKWTHQTALGKCFSFALVDVPIVWTVCVFPSIINPLVGMF
jgi:hypothetical protein